MCGIAKGKKNFLFSAYNNWNSCARRLGVSFCSQYDISTTEHTLKDQKIIRSKTVTHTFKSPLATPRFFFVGCVKFLLYFCILHLILKITNIRGWLFGGFCLNFIQLKVL